MTQYDSYDLLWLSMTHKSHVKFISFDDTMLNGSLSRRKTALIDQRAVAAGKNMYVIIVTNTTRETIGLKLNWAHCAKLGCIFSMSNFDLQEILPLCKNLFWQHLILGKAEGMELNLFV